MRSRSERGLSQRRRGLGAKVCLAVAYIFVCFEGMRGAPKQTAADLKCFPCQRSFERHTLKAHKLFDPSQSSNCEWNAQERHSPERNAQERHSPERWGRKYLGCQRGGPKWGQWT